MKIFNRQLCSALSLLRRYHVPEGHLVDANPAFALMLSRTQNSVLDVAESWHFKTALISVIGVPILFLQNILSFELQLAIDMLELRQTLHVIQRQL